VKSIHIDAKAEAELEEAVAYYTAKRPELGEELRAEAERAVDMIQQSPLWCPRYKATTFRMCILRKFPYSLIYKERDDSIWIAAVAHHKRKPGYWKRRAPE